MQMAAYEDRQSSDPRTKRILIIGAKGMLGRDLVNVLSSTFHKNNRLGWEISAWDIDEIDIRDEKSTVAKIEHLRPGIIINVAGYTDVDGCELNEEKAFAVNAEGMKHVALGALRCRSKVVYLSTDYIFDGEKKEPYLENDPPNPLNVYGRSKWKGEQYVQQLVEDVLIIRTQWLYGKYGKNFVASILNQARDKRVLSIVNDQIGSPTYTVDLSEAISILLQGDARGVFHVSNKDLCSWYTFGQTILKLIGMDRVKVVPITSKELIRPASRPLYTALNCQKLKQVTGMAMRPWSEALKDFLLPAR
jgi:dTDP-4-dehydrorhamnose reductase